MPNIEQFFLKVAGAKSEIKDIDPVINNIGDLKELSDIDVIVRSLINLLLTSKGTYLFDADYGCNLYKYVFEPADEITQRDIYMELETAIRRYETRGKITYNVKFFSNKKGFVVDLMIDYKDRKKKVGITIDESILKNIT